MHAKLAKFKALIQSLVLFMALCVPHAGAQDFTVNLKDTDIQEFGIGAMPCGMVVQQE